jgi:Na+/H+ antiporter NhaD/arsenite permease-like protein
MLFTISILFCIAYACIALENVIKINKSAIAIISGILCWVLLIAMPENGQAIKLRFFEQTAEIAGILFFLMGAMTIVEIVDLHQGFSVVTALLSKGSKLRLLWLIGLIGFFLSAVLDNLTTTIVMVSVLSKILSKRDDLLLFTGVTIISVNAGGAWSPIGDVTTTMLWIGGQITTMSIVAKCLVPSLVCTVVTLVWASVSLGKDGGNSLEIALENNIDKRDRKDSVIVFFLGVCGLLFVPVFKMMTGLPPYAGMMFVLGLVWLAVELLHLSKSEEYRQNKSVASALERIDLQSILFFLGILLSVGALQTVGALPRLASWLDHTFANIDVIVITIGLLSSIVDNVPLVAAGIKMYPLSQFGTNHHFWSFLAFCAGTGGSILVIGSAAGVAAMGMTKMDFFWYCRKISPMALVGYFAGCAAYLGMTGLFH